MRQIDADKLKKSMERMLCTGKEPDEERYTCDVVCCVIDEAPTVDAEPVQHARWEWSETWSDETPEYPRELVYDGWACSFCGIYLLRYLQYNFHAIPEYAECASDEPPTVERCPCCGAKMGGLNMNQYDVAGTLKTYADKAAKAQTSDDLKNVIRKVREAFDLRQVKVESEG